MEAFTTEDDEQLIHVVSNYPELYDPKNESYKLTVKKDVKWRSIAEIMNKEVGSCKRRWKNIRDNYYKQKKKETQTTGSASQGNRKRNPLLEQLSFLEAVEHERRVLTSNTNAKVDHSQEIFSGNSNDEAMHQTINSESRKTVKEICTSNSKSMDDGTERQISKRKKDFSSGILKALQKGSDTSDYIIIKQLTASPPMQPASPEDEIDLLFKSFAKTVKAFPPLLKAETKSKIFRIISDAELQLLHPRNASCGLSTYSYDTSLTSTPQPSPSASTWDQHVSTISDTAQYFGNFEG